MGKNVTEAKVNEFGSRLNTIGAKLDEMLKTGLNTREAHKNLNIRSQQIFQHFKKLKDRGYMVGGRIKCGVPRFQISKSFLLDFSDASCRLTGRVGDYSSVVDRR